MDESRANRSAAREELEKKRKQISGSPKGRVNSRGDYKKGIGSRRRHESSVRSCSRSVTALVQRALMAGAAYGVWGQAHRPGTGCLARGPFPADGEHCLRARAAARVWQRPPQLRGPVFLPLLPRSARRRGEFTTVFSSSAGRAGLEAQESRPTERPAKATTKTTAKTTTTMATGCLHSSKAAAARRLPEVPGSCSTSIGRTYTSILQQSKATRRFSWRGWAA